MTIATALARFPLRSEAEARAAVASTSEGAALQQAVELSRDLTALIVRAQALRKVRTMPDTIRETLGEFADLLDDALGDASPEVAVERYEADAPAGERGAVAYAREVAADLRGGE